MCVVTTVSFPLYDLCFTCVMHWYRKGITQNYVLVRFCGGVFLLRDALHGLDVYKLNLHSMYH